MSRGPSANPGACPSWGWAPSLPRNSAPRMWRRAAGRPAGVRRLTTPWRPPTERATRTWPAPTWSCVEGTTRPPPPPPPRSPVGTAAGQREEAAAAPSPLPCHPGKGFIVSMSAPSARDTAPSRRTYILWNMGIMTILILQNIANTCRFVLKNLRTVSP